MTQTVFNFNEFMENFADEIGGQFSEYDQSKSVIIVPLEENRFQAVLGVMKYNEKFKKKSPYPLCIALSPFLLDFLTYG